MINKLRARIQDEKGFTLIELLVVILIIGILAAIALPAFLNQRAKAQDSTAKSDVRTAQTAMETYYTDNQDYTRRRPARQRVAAHRAGPEERQRPRRSTARRRTGYTITVTSKASGTGAVYSITNTGGTVTRTCAQAEQGRLQRQRLLVVTT